MSDTTTTTNHPAREAARAARAIEPERAEAKELLELAPDAIEAAPENPREIWDGPEFDELVRSIERHGILQPLVVRRAKGDAAQPARWELLCGERRLRAARALRLATVPCVRLDVPDERKREVMLIENLHREDLDPIATAKAYRALIDEHGLTQDELARRLAKSRPAITNALRLLELPGALQGEVARGAITAGHARAIAGLAAPEAQAALARRVEREGLSVRETEAAVKEAKAPEAAAKRRLRRAGRAGYLDVLEDQLRKALGTKVKIETSGPASGRIVIDFYSDAEFERLLEYFS
jgi:ParB family chromosome partitioning protein